LFTAMTDRGGLDVTGVRLFRSEAGPGSARWNIEPAGAGTMEH
jgi:hypothetical protein